MAEAAVGDRVEVLDPYLAQMREIMRRATGHESSPNHVGVVEEIKAGTAYILFDDTAQLAPYPLDEVQRIASPPPPSRHVGLDS